jgi:hypothetical protein
MTSWPSTHGASRVGRHGLDEDRERARVLEGARVGDEAVHGGGVAALHAVAAQLAERLGRQADVAHHGDARVGDRAHARRHARAALELHRVAPGLHEGAGVAHGVRIGGLVGEERQVADHERMARAAHDGLGEHEHLLHADRERVGQAEHRHRGRVADEQYFDTRAMREGRGGIVVRGDAHHGLAGVLALAQRVRRDLHGRHPNLLGQKKGRLPGGKRPPEKQNRRGSNGRRPAVAF